MKQKQESETGRSRVRETLLVIVLGFGLLYLWLDRAWLLYTALGTGVAGMLSLSLNRLIHQGWFLLGDLLGRVMGKVLLGVIFFLVLVPVSLLSRLFKREVMQLKKPSGGTFITRDHRYRPEDMENMW
jgi:hypothetical protein